MRPMTLAHTSVELPKYGASRRDAQISTARDDAPDANTTACSQRTSGCYPAAGAVQTGGGPPNGTGRQWEGGLV